MLVMRLLLGAVAAWIAVKYLGQLPSGAVTWAVSEGDNIQHAHYYRAVSPAALAAAVVNFGSYMFGLLVFALRPVAALRPLRIIAWLAVCAVSTAVLHWLSEYTGMM